MFPAFVFALLLLSVPAVAETFTSGAIVTDGDTIRIGETAIRLYGIDAPELDQTCAIDGKPYQCGAEARRALEGLLTAPVTCQPRTRDADGRIVALCKVWGADLGELMVRMGWALGNAHDSDRRYREAEAAARADGAGLWGGEFTAPWEWRQEN